MVNNANPLSLSTGNPALRPRLQQLALAATLEADPSRSRSKFLFMNVARTSDPIANSTFTARFDTTVGGIFLGRGTQLTRAQEPERVVERQPVRRLEPSAQQDQEHPEP